MAYMSTEAGSSTVREVYGDVFVLIVEQRHTDEESGLWPVGSGA